MNNKTALNEIEGILMNSTDSGRKGKAFEGVCKIALNKYIRGLKVVTSNRQDYDFLHSGFKFEAKTGCGELDTLIKHCEANHNIIVIYSPTASWGNHYYIKVSDFLSGLNEIGLIRSKTSTRGKQIKAIQSFKNSRKKTIELYDMLERYSFEPQITEALDSQVLELLREYGME